MTTAIFLTILRYEHKLQTKKKPKLCLKTKKSLGAKIHIEKYTKLPFTT